MIIVRLMPSYGWDLFQIADFGSEGGFDLVLLIKESLNLSGLRRREWRASSTVSRIASNPPRFDLVLV
jgi:hypothetical protein